MHPRGARNAEVGDVNVPFRVEQQICRLDVSVHDAFTMCDVERASGFLEPREDLFGRTGAFGAKDVVERSAAEVLHDDVGTSVVLADVEDRDGVRLTGEAGGRQRLPCEPLTDRLVLRVAIGENLDRHDAAEHRVGGGVDIAHATVPDPFGASVARRQDVDLNGHSASSTSFPPSWSRKR